MKQHFIKKHNSDKEAEEYGYTEFEIPDKDIHNAILEHVKTIDTKTFKGDFFEEGVWTIVEDKGDKIKCTNTDGEVKNMRKSTVEIYLREKVLESIEEKFPVTEFFPKIYGKLFYRQAEKGYISVSTLDLKGINDFLSGGPSSVRAFEETQDMSIHVEKNNYISLTARKGGETMSVYFNANGNLMNRDYNLDMSLYEQGEYDTKEIVDMFFDALKEIGDVETNTKGSVFFVPGFAIEIEYVDRKEGLVMQWIKGEGDTYKRPGYKAIKKPKTAKKLTSDEFVELIKNSIPDSMKEVLKIQ